MPGNDIEDFATVLVTVIDKSELKTNLVLLPLPVLSILGGGHSYGSQDLQISSSATSSQYSQGTTPGRTFEEIDLI